MIEFFLQVFHGALSSVIESLIFIYFLLKQIIDEVLPMLYEVRLSDPEIVLRVVREYFFCSKLNNLIYRAIQFVACRLPLTKVTILNVG